MISFDELLQKARYTPGLYLGQKSLTSLFYFYLGYNFKSIEIDPGYPCSLNGFEEYVHNCYQGHLSNNWYVIILNDSQSEEEAFDKFYELFDKFLASKDSSSEKS